MFTRQELDILLNVMSEYLDSYTEQEHITMKEFFKPANELYKKIENLLYKTIDKS